MRLCVESERLSEFSVAADSKRAAKKEKRRSRPPRQVGNVAEQLL